MVSFSKLISLPDRISRAVDNVVKLTERIVGTTSSLGDKVDDLQTTVVPPVVEAASTFSSLCAKIEFLLVKVTSIFDPLFRAFSFLKSFWVYVVEAVVGIFKKCHEKVSLFFIRLIVESDDSWDFLFPALITCCSIVAFGWALPDHLKQSIFSSLSCAVSVCLSFLETLLPQSWVPEWLRGFLHVNDIVAQASVTGPPVEGVDMSFSSSSLTSLLLFGLSTFAFCASSASSSVRKNKTNNPIADVLWSSGDYAAKCHQLFILYRNMKDHAGALLGKILDFVFELFGQPNTSLAAINAIIETDLFKWMREVEAACDPLQRLERYAQAEFGEKLSTLREQNKEIQAACTLRIPSVFLTSRLQKCRDLLEKTWSDYCAHRGVGKSRPEPFMMQWYGRPGVGKTLVLNYFINDLFDILDEPKVNRLYAVPTKDQYWSGYAHQTGVLFDGLGAIMDPSGQCEDVKMMIHLKSSQPAGLPMAAIEDKGTHFDSKYIFCTSNAPEPPPSSGLVTPEAFSRRRDLLVEVERIGTIDPKNPAQGIFFTIRDRHAPHSVIDNLSKLPYNVLMDIVVREVRQFQKKGEDFRAISSLYELNETFLDAQVSPEKPINYMVESCKRAFNGALGDDPFMCNKPVSYGYQALEEEEREEIFRYCQKMIASPITDTIFHEIMIRVPADYVRYFEAYVPYCTFDEDVFFRNKGKNFFLHDCLKMTGEDEHSLELVEMWPLDIKYFYTQIVRYRTHLLASIPKMSESRMLSFSSWLLKFIDNTIRAIGKLPLWVRLFMKMLAVYMLVKVSSEALFRVFSLPRMLCDAISGASIGTVADKIAPIANVSNQSGDYNTSRVHRRPNKYLIHQQFGVENASWSEKSNGDPFLATSLKKNLVVLKLGSGEFF